MPENESRFAMAPMKRSGCARWNTLIRPPTPSSTIAPIRAICLVFLPGSAASCARPAVASRPNPAPAINVNSTKGHWIPISMMVYSSFHCATDGDRM